MRRNVTCSPSNTRDFDAILSAFLRISSTICSADFSRAPGMSSPPAGMPVKPSSTRRMSLMM